MLLTMQNFIKLCPRVNVSLGLYCYILFRSLLRHCCCYLLSKVVRKPTLHCQGCVAIIPCLSKSRIITRHNSCRYKSPAPSTPTPHILGQVYARKLTQAWLTDEGEDCDWGIQALVCYLLLKLPFFLISQNFAIVFKIHWIVLKRW